MSNIKLNTNFNKPISTNEFIEGKNTRDNYCNISAINMNNYSFLITKPLPLMDNIEIYYQSFNQGGIPTRYNKKCYN